MGCDGCKSDTTRLFIRSKDFTESEYTLIKDTLLEVGQYLNVQAEGTIDSIRMQRSLLSSKIIRSLSDTVIYSGDKETATKLLESFNSNGIDCYIHSPEKYRK